MKAVRNDEKVMDQMRIWNGNNEYVGFIYFQEENYWLHELIIKFSANTTDL